MPSIVCPYCFYRTSGRRLGFRCIQSMAGTRNGRPCAAEIDGPLSAFLGRETKSGPVFHASGRGRSAACPECGVKSTKRVCPECHNDLPGGYEGTRGRIIALVGPKTSGKSTYTTVLVRELRERVGELFDAAVSPMDDRTAERYADAETELYEQNVLPGITASASLNLIYPLLFRVSVRRPGPFGITRIRSCSLVFFDTAGEDVQSAEQAERNVAYLARADGIVLLVDPLQFGAVRDTVHKAAVRLPDRGTAPERVVAIVADLVRAHRDLPPGKRLRTPLAVALTKTDTLTPLLDGDGSPLRTPSRHDGVLDERDRLEVGDTVCSLLQDWDGGKLRRQVEADFALSAFFGISALGGEPEGASRGPAGGVHPFRVEDPVLWLFSRFGLVSVRKAGRS